MLTPVTDLGTLKFGEPYSFRFLLKNNGDREVTVTKLTAGCSSCTKLSMPRMYIGPTEQGVVNVVFTPGTLGPQRKSITVTYDNQSLRLEFIADVKD